MKKLLLILLCLPLIGLGQHGQCISGDCSNKFGTYHFPNGDIYEGNWCGGLMHGEGTYTSYDGTIIKSFWENGFDISGKLTKEQKKQLYHDKALANIELECYINYEEYVDNKLQKGDFNFIILERFIKEFVEKDINEWQSKGEFEKTNDYLVRVNEKNRAVKIKEFQEAAMESLKLDFLNFIDFSNIELGDYDADNETFLLKDKKLGDLVISVPINEAKLFKTNFSYFNFLNPECVIIDDKFVLSYVELAKSKNLKDYYNYLEKYIDNWIDFENIIVPTSVGINAAAYASLNVLIGQLVEIHIKKNILVDGGQINNPAISQYNRKSKQLVIKLKEAISTSKSANNLVVKDFETKYTYNLSNNQDYAITEIDYEFSPIDIDGIVSINKSKSSNISTNKIKVGTSSVNMNIPTNKKVKNRYALIIGNEDYSSFQRTLSSEQNVDYAVNDATIFKQYCLKTLGVKEENMNFLTNATAGAMNQKINKMLKLMNKLGNEAELIVYYAGHGYPDERTKAPYLIPVDVSGTDLSFAIKLEDLYRNLGTTNARITIFLDACFTGGGRNSGLVASRGVKVKPKEGTLNGNIVVFSASREEQSALPYHKESHGMFTYYLLKKLQESEGKVSMGDLSDYIINQVSIQSININEKEQDPKVNTSPKVINDWRNWKF